MGKIKTLALTSIMLSSTVLGASPLIVQAKEKAAPTITATRALTEATTSTPTAAKGTATTFADLKNNATMSVAPIFGKSGSDFNTDLANELNITTSKTDTTQIPMTVVESNKFGFATKVTFTNGDKTKAVNVQYNYAKPTVSFGKDNASQVMNFTTKTAPAQTDFASKVVNKDVTATTTNGTDAKGVKNSATLLTDMSTSDIQDPGSYTVTYTPRDNYTTGDAVNRTVNVFGEPDWTQLDNYKITAGDTAGVSGKVVINNKHGQKFLVTTTAVDGTTENKYGTAADFNAAKAGTYSVKYSAQAIDDNGNLLKDSSTGNALTFDDDNPATIQVVDPDGTGVTSLPYTINFTYDKNIVGTQFGTTDNNLVKPDAPSTEESANKSSDTDKTTDSQVEEGETEQPASKADATEPNTTVDVKAPTGYTLAKSTDSPYTFTDAKRTVDIDVVPASLKYTVNYVDEATGKTVKTDKDQTGTYGSYISLKAPEGYELSNVVDRGFTLKKDGYERTVYVSKRNVSYVITFLDQETGRTIGITTGEGADGDDVTLTAPDGYSFINADDIQMTINKDNPNKSIEVAPNSSDFMGTLTTYPNSGYTDLYSSKGKLLDDVVLSSNSNWITDKKIYVDGVKYYRVATNEYVKASDSYLYTPMSKIAQTNGKAHTKVYDSKGTLVNDRALATNSAWKVDKAARINGHKMYRVATNEWVMASDVTIL
ncbi:SLAP domain-containing protein [Companilactobacillus insicii]|uniref:SLAP domain-containing protein n=1 Tax=Companilactobacillus insicii TaxID=1732567 RepID=UPI000F7B4E1B|nr:SLAP domain-containing protein [Companilactobacillus insicii]